MTDSKRKIALLIALALAGAALFVGWGLVREKGSGDSLVANGTIEPRRSR